MPLLFGMKRDVEYDELTGVTRTFDYDSDPGKVVVHTSQDIEAAVDYARARRQIDKPVQEETWNHYAIIPEVVQHQMYQKGIDVARDGKAVFEFINKYYPCLRLTEKWHDDRRAKAKDTKIIVK